MDTERFAVGEQRRRDVLGNEYVDQSLRNADAFNRPFQELVTEYCWGECWGDPTLVPRERSLLNLGMIAALGKMHEFELHVRGALKNGVSHEQLRAALIQIAVYCGIPVGVDCFRVARKVLAEQNAAPSIDSSSIREQ
ncbi:carboxymuconolactone decarboxylase family protein [Paraburkholderia xenovorans LB400]|uniref:4-carboxymuconolactone decarboxylase n=1 Tax=Paraburkholderia xenovorans (strain LB400) TaxID=266265 RepID=Q13PH2_PARXL|nr:carboxymuconolactone decarboxylase family protein [Paraburkholderia xenovorans]ABE34017.1 4-carboxymuconolactone decarboxylase [Paraburkholderia xenovorans LB400]AIP37418.1 carboxymuconolactone decarboxylase family protein [Paraburkholderia xenovorans LB400]NPT37767.1 4-carboxymuconolactone decarboxylase [Paraburkholderia xenovorans]